MSKTSQTSLFRYASMGSSFKLLRKMRIMQSLIFLLFFGLGGSLNSAKSALDLTDGFGFQGDGWSFIVEQWRVDKKEEEKKEVSITIAYRMPKGSRFILMISKEPKLGLYASNLDSHHVQEPKEGTVTLEFEDTSDDNRYFISLWEGINREVSPSGILHSYILIDLSPTITRFGK